MAGETLMKIISFAQWLFGPRAAVPEEKDIIGWIRDPLAHPAFDKMSERELGDLPFNRSYRGLRDRGFAEDACR
jgi:hypothetical protein